jgi:type I restriction enzyme R subunit
LPREVGDLFHKLRKLGNAAAHEGTGNHAEALSGLRFARQLAVWFHRAYGKQPDFRPGPFVPPGDPEDPTAPLKGEIETLRQKLIETERSAELARQAAESEIRARESVEARLQREAEERAVWEQLAAEAEAARVALAGALSSRQPSPEVLHQREAIALASTGIEAGTAARLVEVQQEAEQAPRSEELALLQRGEEAASRIDLDEAETRALIDQQLRDRDWEADTKLLRYARGVRPAKNRNMAIAEWPTSSGPADYALFVGLKLVGLVEAKRKRKNVSALSINPSGIRWE